jgi:hypothetical protein
MIPESGQIFPEPALYVARVLEHSERGGPKAAIVVEHLCRL